MILYLIRHGNPVYGPDILTDLGHREAAKCAQRLDCEPLDELYSSSMGRAIQTALYCARRKQLPVTVLHFMREIAWSESTNGDPETKGNPWKITREMVKNGEDLYDPNWEHSPRFEGNQIAPNIRERLAQFREFMESQGYRYENGLYRGIAPTQKRIAIFCHGGISTVLLSDLLRIPFLAACLQIKISQSSITAVEFDAPEGGLCIPRVLTMSDIAHMPAPAGTIA